MSVRPTDSIIGPSRGKPADWYGAVDANPNIANKDQVKQFIRDVYTVNKGDDMPDAALVTAQAFVETGNFTNRWWKERLNAGSLGVTGDPLENEASPTFKTTMAAARAMSAHDLLYATGDIARGGLVPVDDPRYDAWMKEYKGKTFPKLADLATRYAVDPDYAETIAARAAAVYGGVLPDQGGDPVATLVFGKVPRPNIEVMICKKAGPGHGYYEVSPRQLVGGCRHITDGNASIEWYHDFFSLGGERADDALVDFIIDKDGRIAMFNDPWGTRSPWANGGSDGLEGDGIAFVNTLGVSAINNRLFSVEHIGKSPEKLTPAQFKSSVALWAYMFDQMRVPYTSYPVNPAVGLRTDLEHWEFATKPCPGDGVRSQVDDHQEAVILTLKQFQTSGNPDEPAPEIPPAPAPSIYPPGMTIELARRLYGKLKVEWAAQPFTFDPERSECRFWLDAGKRTLQPGDDYTKGSWPTIKDCVRRGNGNRVFTWEGGLVFEQAARSN